MVRPRTGEKDKVLIESAIQLFLKDGVRRTTIKKIADHADVAVGTVYVYFKNKIEIVKTVAYAFSDQHYEFAQDIIQSSRSPLAKLNAYVLGFYDMWQPFGENTKASIELAVAVLKHAPDTPGIAEERNLATIEQILTEAKNKGMRVSSPVKEARWVALSTSVFFPLAGTPIARPTSSPLQRKDLEGLLKWIGQKLT